MPPREADIDETTNAVAALLRETGQAHHQAYLVSDGEDPEWPWWYADHLAVPLARLGHELTRSAIVFVLVGAVRDLSDVGGAWSEAYAARLIAEAA